MPTPEGPLGLRERGRRRSRPVPTGNQPIWARSEGGSSEPVLLGLAGQPPVSHVFAPRARARQAAAARARPRPLQRLVFGPKGSAAQPLVLGLTPAQSSSACPSPRPARSR